MTTPTEEKKEEKDPASIEAAHESLKWLITLILKNVPLIEDGRTEVLARGQAVLNGLPEDPRTPKPNRQTRRTTAKGTKPAAKGRTAAKR